NTGCYCGEQYRVQGEYCVYAIDQFGGGPGDFYELYECSPSGRSCRYHCDYGCCQMPTGTKDFCCKQQHCSDCKGTKYVDPS
ncbi:28364_t:CDS:2, partial [Gigaspora margarita]